MFGKLVKKILGCAIYSEIKDIIEVIGEES